MRRIRAGKYTPMMGGLSLGLLSVVLLPLTWISPAPPPVPLAPPRVRQWGYQTPSAAVLREARWLRARAQMAVNRERSALEAWDPEVYETASHEPLRRELMAADKTGELRRARVRAQQAAALARTPEESYQATLLLSSIACEAGDHAAELGHARKLIAFQPHRKLSLMYLRRAAVCNRLVSMTKDVDAELVALQSPAKDRDGGESVAQSGTEEPHSAAATPGHCVRRAATSTTIPSGSSTLNASAGGWSGS